MRLNGYLFNPIRSYAVVEIDGVIGNVVSFELEGVEFKMKRASNHYVKGRLSKTVDVMVVDGTMVNMDWIYDVARIIGAMYNRNYKEVMSGFEVFGSGVNSPVGVVYGKYMGVVAPIVGGEVCELQG